MASNRTIIATSAATDHENSPANNRSQPSKLTIICNNIGHTSHANDTVRILRDDLSASLIMIQEPLINKRNNKVQGWGSNPCHTPLTLRSSSRVCTVAVSDHIGNTHVTSQMPDKIAVNRITWNGQHFLIINVYMAPRTSITDELSILSDLLSNRKEQNVIIAGDWNSRSNIWGDHVSDERSDLITAFAAQHALEVMANESDLPTFVHSHEGSSHIDFVLGKFSSAIRASVRTIEEITHDHRPLIITLHARVTTTHVPIQRYNMNKADWSKFGSCLQSADHSIIKCEQDVDKQWDLLLTLITGAADQSIPKKTSRPKKVTYWSQELTDLRSVRNRSKCALIAAQTSGSSSLPSFTSAYQRANKDYKIALQKAKIGSFSQFIERESETDPWSIAYKVCRDKVPGLKHLIAVDRNGSVEDTMQSVLEQFFPARSRSGVFNETASDSAPDDLPLTTHEIRAAVHTMSLDKAPGEDLITGRMLREAYDVIPDVFDSMYSSCYSMRKFPAKWKEAILAVVPKPGKDNYDQLASFRPISLLSVPGKVLDKILIKRINHHLYSTPNLMS